MATIRKRGDKYQAQVRRQGHQPLSRSFHRLRDAKDWAREAESRTERSTSAVALRSLKELKLADLVQRYLIEVVPLKKGAEYEAIILSAFLRHPICDKWLNQLTSADFAAYRDERLRDISPASLKRQLSPVRNMFAIAASDWGLPLDEKPINGCKINAGERSRERRLLPGEIQEIIQTARTRRNPYIIPIILFALETAMRRGEMLGICWSDINWERRSVTLSDTKNGHSRIVPLTPKAFAIISELPKDTEAVFPTTANAVRLLWQRITKDAGIVDLHFHDLRHEAISRFFEMGLSVPEVALLSGHRDPRMLLRYAHPMRERILETFDKAQS